MNRPPHNPADNFVSEQHLRQYEELAHMVLSIGKLKETRTGMDTIGIFGHQMRFNLSTGEFPLLTTKKVFTRGIFEELKFFIKGETNNNVLTDKNVHIWDAWALENGELGPIYGEIWRRFPAGVPVETLQQVLRESGDTKQNLTNALHSLISDPKYKPIDQLSQLLDDLQKRPFSRRHLVSAWAPTVLPDESVSPKENVKNGKQCLAACHTFWQVYVEAMSFDEAFTYREANYENLIRAFEEDLERAEEELAAAQEAGFQGVNRSPEELEKAIELLKADVFGAREQFEEFQKRVVPGYEGELLPRKRLSMQLYQRSADIPLGVPFNIASYAALLQLLATKSGMMAGDFIHDFGDAHVYVNQVELLEEQIRRDTRKPPVLLIGNVTNVQGWSDVDGYDFRVVGYDPHPAIKYPGAAV